MPKEKTFDAWQKLDDVDHEAAQAAIPGFRAYCSETKDYRPLYAERFLKERRFDGFSKATATTKSTSQVWVSHQSPAGEAWREFKKRTTGKYPPSDQKGGWCYPTEWPPVNGNVSHDKT